MKKKITRGSQSMDPDFYYLENKLQTSLKPVSPRPDFVADLKQQLNFQFKKLPSLSQLSQSNAVLVAFALILGIILLIFFSVRAAITLISAFSLLYQYRRQAQVEKSPHLTLKN
jgi:uncharacterized membrane protein